MKMVQVIKYNAPTGWDASIGQTIHHFEKEIGLVVEIEGRQVTEYFYEPIDEQSDALDWARNQEGYESVEHIPLDEAIELLETAVKFTYHQPHFKEKMISELEKLKKSAD